MQGCPLGDVDEDAVRAEIADVRSGAQTLRRAAHRLGCRADELTRRVWAEVKADVFARDGMRCVRCGTYRALDAHHRLPRGLGGTSQPLVAFGLANLVSLCRDCHTWVEHYREQALDEGWLVRQGADPELVALPWNGRNVRLRNDGGWTVT